MPSETAPIFLYDSVCHLLNREVEFGNVAEWLRRSPAKAVRNAFVSSNLTVVEKSFFFSIIFSVVVQMHATYMI